MHLTGKFKYSSNSVNSVNAINVSRWWLCMCTVYLVANKGPVRLCVFAEVRLGYFAVEVYTCTGLTCQLWAPQAQHEASQQENKGHSQ